MATKYNHNIIKDPNLRPTNTKNLASKNILSKIDFGRANLKNELKLTQQIYKKQCPGLVSPEKQNSLIKILTIGRLYSIPFLLLLVDCYTRDRLKYYLDNQTSKNLQALDIKKWSSHFINRVKKKNQTIKKIKNDIAPSIKLFFKRYAAKFTLDTNSEKINDDRLDFAKYTLAATCFVNKLINSHFITLPFQIDVIILPSDVQNDKKYTVKRAISTLTIPDDDTDDDDDDGIDDDLDNDLDNDYKDIDDDDDDDISVVNDNFIDTLSASIIDRFKHNNCKYDIHSNKIIPNKNNIKASAPNRLFHGFYNKNFAKLMADKYNDKTNKIQYPNHKRFAIAINRWRDGNNNNDPLDNNNTPNAPSLPIIDDHMDNMDNSDNDLNTNNVTMDNTIDQAQTNNIDNITNDNDIVVKKKKKKKAVKINAPVKIKAAKKKKGHDTIYIFEPSLNNQIPSNGVPEWGLEASFKSIIPSIPNQSGCDDITAKTGGSGYVFVLSYHVYSLNCIRCYCFWRGQIFRFLPNDILSVWPLMFNKKNRKLPVKKREMLKETVNKIDKLMLRWDIQFKKFCKTYSFKKK